MTMLNTEANLPDPDGFYEMLIAMHRDLTEEESRMADARLILLLANHIGDTALLKAAMVRARRGLGSEAASAVPGTSAAPER